MLLRRRPAGRSLPRDRVLLSSNDPPNWKRNDGKYLNFSPAAVNCHYGSNHGDVRDSASGEEGGASWPQPLDSAFSHDLTEFVAVLEKTEPGNVGARSVGEEEVHLNSYHPPSWRESLPLYARDTNAAAIQSCIVQARLRSADQAPLDALARTTIASHRLLHMKLAVSHRPRPTTVGVIARGL